MRRTRPGWWWRRRRGLLAALLALAPVLALVVMPAARAGELPFPVRRPGGAVLRTAGGPAPSSYPYRVGPAPALDAYGFVIGQCTSFVAWWLNRRGVPFGVITVGPRGAGWFLNASSWDAAARAAGFAVGPRPVVGAVAQWRAGERSPATGDGGDPRIDVAGDTGHVAVVVRVLPDGRAEWLEQGFAGRPALHRGTGFAPRYLYLGVTPPAGRPS